MADWFTTNAPSAPPATSQAPTGDWFAANAPKPEESVPEKSSGEGALATSGVLAGLSAAAPGARWLAEHIATSPTLGRTAGLLSKRLAPLNVGKQLYDVATGKQDITGAATDAALGEGARRLMRPAANLLQRAAAPVAGMSVPVAAGGMAGLAGTAGFLGALQHDANRDVQIDYSKNTPDTWIARALGGRTTDERMDDPNDPMFRPDDQAMVRASVLAQLQGSR